MTEQSKFRLVGFINLFQFVPDFVWSIYEGEDAQLYFAEGRDEDYTITNFEKIKLLH